MRDQKLLDYLESYLTPRRKGLFDKVIAQRTNHFTVATEDVYQLHNTSAVIRSCDVFGVQNVHITEEKNVRKIDREIAMGAQKWVDVNRYHTVKDAVDKLKGKGYQIIATTPHNNACVLDDFDIEKPSAIFFGTEKDGLSEELMQKADGFLKIPMSGFTESLNISVSAAIILQNLTSRLKRSEVGWQLSQEEQYDIRMHWATSCIKSSKEIIERYYKENS
ncbi:TrmH family RNA methyltransferase [Mesonia aestuariivivens]|uniref:tRNA (guanosine(18)-2'-O)-methyltransferase n=1 Tax=Mesonia aestuariivivens TaxID=2796128 RepID=A0ABS6W4V3_9FLAO|nr:RNA methyltransferase [Mesonia aestuariivivens]MBW2962516.1 RNA methyltransferase [Mesonia aestuariivivens]